MADTSGLRLVALKCEKCGSLLNADPGDVVYYCNNCDTGYEIISETDEIVEVAVDFALSGNPMDAEVVYLPFWVFDADIDISSRDAGGTLGSMARFIKTKVGAGDQEKPVEKFYVPAFETSMENIKKLGLEFTRQQPDFDLIKKDRITGCVYSSQDAEKIADFIFLSSEAEKPDMMKHISYTLNLTSPHVVAFPFYKADGLTDGILGIRI
jgi:hypothetical protein